MKKRKGISSPTTITISLVAILLASIFGVLEYIQSNNLHNQNNELSSSLSSYSSGVSELQSETQSLGAQLAEGSNASSNVFQSWIAHLSKLQRFDPNSALADYAPNATVVWSGDTQGWGGNYTGRSEIGTILNSWFQENGNGTATYPIALAPNSLYLRIDSTNITREASGGISIGARLDFSGQSRILGAFNGTISSKSVYVPQNGTWLISREDWHFETFNMQYSRIGP